MSGRQLAVLGAGRSERTQLTNAERERICQLKQQQPQLKHDEFVAFACAELGKQVNRSTISKIVKESERWLNIPEEERERKRHKKGQFEDVEEALFQFYKQVCYNSVSAWAAHCGQKLNGDAAPSYSPYCCRLTPPART